MVHRIFLGGKAKRGGPDIIMDFLLEKGKEICLLEHSLDCNNDSVFKILEGDKEEIIEVVKIVPSKPPFRWLIEIFKSVNFIFRNFDFIPYCIAVDPLNVIVALVLKKIKKIGKIYFHCIDYSENRFSNRIFNKIYSFMYCYALRKADICGVVSKRMFDKFISFGIEKEKLFFIPNSPLFKEVNLNSEKRNKFSVVIMGGRVDAKCDYRKIIRVLAKLKPDFPQLEFRIIGAMEDKIFLFGLKEYIKSFSLDHQVSFLGFFSEPDDLQQVLLNSGIGMTSYIPSKTGHYGIYGDSLRIREYALYGLPIVADDMYSTAFEAQKYKCGFVTVNEEEMLTAIKRLWIEEGLYEKYSANALKWAKEFDKRKILEELLLRLEAK